MTDISGVITTHLAALGTGTRDRRVFAILTRNPQFIEDEPVIADNGEVWVDIRNTVDGILMKFRDGELDRVRVTARRLAAPGPVDLDTDFYPYPAPQDLIKGLDLTSATPSDVKALLGESEAVGTGGGAGDGVGIGGPGGGVVTGGPDAVGGGEPSGDLTYRVHDSVVRLSFDGEQLLSVTTSRH